MERTAFICQPCLAQLRHTSREPTSRLQRSLLASLAATPRTTTSERIHDTSRIQPTRSPLPYASNTRAFTSSATLTADSQTEVSFRKYVPFAIRKIPQQQGPENSEKNNPGRGARRSPHASLGREDNEDNGSTYAERAGANDDFTQRPVSKSFREWELAMADIAEQRAFDRTNYPLDDREFWSKFDELWAQPTEDSAPQSPANSTTPAGANMTKPQKGRRISAAMSRRMKQDRHRELQEVVFLTRNCDPKDRAEVKARFKAWRRRFARVYDHMLKGKPFHAKHKLLGEDDLVRLLELEGVEEMRLAWQRETEERRIALWPNVMLSALRLRPTKAHAVLEATFDEATTPSYAVRDTVCFLVRQSIFLDFEERRRTDKTSLDLVLYLLNNSANRYLQFPQWVLFTLVKGLETDELANLYRELVRYQHLLHTNTLLHVASRLAKDVSHKSTALQILQSIVQSDALDVNTPRGAALCTSILSMGKGDMKSDTPVTPAELFERLLDLGLSPNLLTYTVIIRNLCLNKELDTAWQVFDVMIEHNTSPDARLYSVLLNGAKLCQDFRSILRVVQAASSDNIRDPVVWNDLLHALFLPWLIEARRKGIRPPRVLPAFRSMLEAYVKFFKLDPLRTLISADIDEYLKDTPVPNGIWQAESKVLPLVSSLPALEPQDLIEPGSDTLGIMLMGYVRGFSKAYNIIAFYSQFRSLLQQGDPAAVRLVKERGTLVYDIVLKAVLEWDGLLHVALEVASDMLKGAELASVDPSSLPAESKLIPHHPAPSVYTWSILLNGFMFHRKVGEAERILQMMRQYGVEPSIVTWNTLLAGYTREQEVDRTVKTFQRIENAGLKADNFTFKAFSYLRDKDKALGLMEEMVARRKRWLEKGQGQGGVAREQGTAESEGIVRQLRELESEAEGFDGMVEDEDDLIDHEYDDGDNSGRGPPRF